MVGRQKLRHRKRTGSTIRALYGSSSSAGLLNSQLEEFFKTAVDVRQGCLLSPILSNFFLEKIMQEILHDHHTFFSIGGRPICNLRFAKDIDLTAAATVNFKTSQTDW